MRFIFALLCVSTILLSSAVPISAGQFGELPEPVPLGLTSDFDGIIISLLGTFPKDKAENRIKFLELMRERGVVGDDAAYVHLERQFAEQCIRECEDGQSIAGFLAVLDGVPEWEFPAHTTLRMERDNGEVYIAEKVLRVQYRYRDGWLETEFEPIGLGHSVPLRPNPSVTDFRTDLSVYDSRYYSPDIGHDDVVLALYAIIPRLSEGGQLWPERNRDSFNMRLVSERNLP